jgi:hypothetical protein
MTTLAWLCTCLHTTRGDDAAIMLQSMIYALCQLARAEQPLAIQAVGCGQDVVTSPGTHGHSWA